MRRAAPLGIGSLALAVSAMIAAQTRESGITTTNVLDNDTVRVERLHIAPGAGEIVTATALPTLVVQVTPGAVEISQLEEDSRGARAAGAVNFVPTGRGHVGRNIGTTSFDMMWIGIKPTRTAAPAAPATDAPPGVERTTLIDNDDVRVVRVRFAPGAREPNHTHPNDLLTVQIESGIVGILNGTDLSTANREPGFMQFLPRGVVHAFGSVDTKPFGILSIAIK
jgi:quercetin dioxygenase-like cupin family protein